MTLALLPASIFSFAGKLLGSAVSAPVKAAANVGLDVVSGWIVAGAEAMLKEVVEVISTVTTPSLSVSWFSTSYWQMAALAMLLTLPFLFAAAVQAVIQTNLAILVRAACFDLPVAVLSVTLAAPLITLLLAATDEMCNLVGGRTTGAGFLTLTANRLSAAGSGFMLVVVAVVILLAGMVLLVELIMRSAAIYILVLFLPIGFAAMVWPARRVWIKRMLETLIALILSKFAMVAILSMSVAALASLTASPSALTTAFTAMALTVLAAFSPWALLRLLPFTELAVSAASTLRQEAHAGAQRGVDSASAAEQLGAGLVVDPAMDGLGALRSFVSGNAADDPATAGASRLARVGAERELTSGSGASAPSGSGPGSGGGDDGVGVGVGAPASILPAEPGEGMTAGDPPGVFPGPGTTDAGRAPEASAGPPATAGAASSELSSPGPHAVPIPQPAAPSAVPPGGGLGGPRAATGTREPGPIDDLAPIFDPANEATQINLANPGSGWLVPPEEPQRDGEGQPDGSDA